MSLSENDLKFMLSVNVPVIDTGIAGGTCGTTQVTNLTTGEWVKNMKPDILGGTTKYQYQKGFIIVDNKTESYYNSKAMIENALKDVAVAGTAQVQITDVTDATNTTIRLYGFESTGALAQTEDIAFGGSTALITGTKLWYADKKGIYAAVLLDSTTGLKKTLATADALIYRSIYLGKVPVGRSWAVGLLQIGIVGTMKDGGTSANRLTAPGGISFYKPNAIKDGLDLSAIIATNDQQGIWFQATYYPGMATLRNFDFGLMTEGDDSV